MSETTRTTLAEELARALRGDVAFDGATRAIFATDSSNYRQVPLGVIYPRDETDVIAGLRICDRYRTPVLGRGAGTSLAGQACNVAVIFDMSRYMNQILEIDVLARVARVQPGVVLDQLNGVVRELGLTFGPDPATHAWCTIGGMVGNNSCGTHALHYGKTVDNIEQLTAITYRGERLVLGATSEKEFANLTQSSGETGRIFMALRRLREEFVDEITHGFPNLERRVSGFNLDQLAPDRLHLARALVGSESTCVLVSEITVALSPWPRRRVLVVLGYLDIYQAADDVPRLLAFNPMGLEGFDVRLTEQMRRAQLNVENLDLLPFGHGWLLCEFGGSSEEEVVTRARDLVAQLPSDVTSVIVSDPHEQSRVWQIRESGLGATAHPVDGPVNYEGWEDAAVAPEHLGTYLRGIRDLWHEFGFDGAWYGHFGQGCVHTRNNFNLGSLDGLAQYRAFVERAADLCISLGGSISGEHGDGQARGELLARMFSPRMIEAFRSFKSAWDPYGLMNPGKLIDAYPLDTNLRYGPHYRSSNLLATNFALPNDHGSLQKAVERCVGVGKCRSDEDGVMCPSYRVTRDEKHSTRGRAKLLSELFQGGVIPETWRSEQVFEALDLCLSCKGCVSECPTHVDMATYKAEFLSHYYSRRLRPRSAYALGLLPWVSRLASRMPRVANAVLQGRARPLVMRLAGLSPLRSVPAFALESFRQKSQRSDDTRALEPTVVLWPDTFSDVFSPARLEASQSVLKLVGERVTIPPQWACCGRTLYDSGMLSRARRTAQRVLDVLDPYLQQGLPIIVIEPSCLATFRDEFPNLLGDDPRCALLRQLCRSLGEHLDVTQWTPRVAPANVALSIHPHCHQVATGDPSSDVRVLTRAGFDVELLDLGCCGLAGSFGYQSDHDQLSRQIGADRFIPALKAASTSRRLILDGFSCELQARHLSDVTTTSLAELLAEHLTAPPQRLI